MQELQEKASAQTVETIHTVVAKLNTMFRIAVQEKQTSGGVAAAMGIAKVLGMIVDKPQIKAIVRLPAPAPGVDLGVKLSEEDWGQRLPILPCVLRFTPLTGGWSRKNNLPRPYLRFLTTSQIDHA